MALLPDLALASVLALVVFLVSLGLLVVFVESVRPTHAAAVVVAAVGVSAGLALAGEAGVAFAVLAVTVALLASQAFEWLTIR